MNFFKNVGKNYSRIKKRYGTTKKTLYDTKTKVVKYSKNKRAEALFQVNKTKTKGKRTYRKAKSMYDLEQSNRRKRSDLFAYSISKGVLTPKKKR